MPKADSVLSTQRSLAPSYPPAVRPERFKYIPPYDAAARSHKDGHPLAELIRMREAAADWIDALLAFLDATEGPEDCQQVDDEGIDDDECHASEVAAISDWRLGA